MPQAIRVNEVGQGRERDVRSSSVMDDPDRRLTLCQADQSRNDFAVTSMSWRLREQIALLLAR
jgi:hypothetical protein